MLNIKKTKHNYIISVDGPTPKLVPEWFTDEYWGANNLVVAKKPGRGNTLMVDAGEGEQWALRHYLRGGMVAKLVYKRYLWLGLVRTRVYQEMHMLAELHAKGMPVATPVGGIIRRRGFTYEASLITVRIPNAKPLTEWLEYDLMTDSLWGSIGACIKRFHRYGINHPDITVQNILIDESRKVFLLDFDNAVKDARGPWRQKNMQRFKRSLVKWCNKHQSVLPIDNVWQCVLNSYR